MTTPRNRRSARLAASLLLVGLLGGCAEPAVDYFQGYVDVEYLHLGLPQPGKLVQLKVERGDPVAVDQLLLALESEREQAALSEAQSRVLQALAQEGDLGTGKRPDERAVIRAQLAQAQTAAALSEKEAERRRSLVQRKLLAAELADEAETLMQRDRQRVNELRAQLRVADLPAREGQLDAARAQVSTADAVLAQAQWNLDQRRLSSPVSGWVHEVYFRPGEWAGAGVPLLAIAPEDRFEVRFFVPTEDAASLKVGDPVRISSPGLAKAMDARITHVADQAEYAPPLIFSRDRNEKLLFQVRALIDNQGPDGRLRLNPGLPVEVRRP